MHAIRLLHIFSFSSDSGRDSLLPARVQKLLGSDDVYGSWLRAWLRHLRVPASTKPVVRIRGHVAQQSCGRTVHSPCQPDREMRTGARRGLSIAARGGSSCRTLGSVAAAAVAILGIPTMRPLHVRFNGLRANPLRGGCVRRDGHGDAGVCNRWLGDEDAGRSCDDSALDRWPAKLRSSTLEDSGDAKQDSLTGDSAHEL